MGSWPEVGSWAGSEARAVSGCWSEAGVNVCNGQHCSEESSVATILAEGSGVVTIFAESSGMAAIFAEGSGMVAILGRGS